MIVILYWYRVEKNILYHNDINVLWFYLYGRSDGMYTRHTRQSYRMTQRQKWIYRSCLLGVLIVVVAF